jgi:hypothetical protein
MELPEGQRAPLGQSGQGGVPQSPPVETNGGRSGRRQGRLVVRRRSSRPALAHPGRPQLVPCSAQTVEHPQPLSGQPPELGIDLVQVLEQVLPLEVDAEPDSPAHVGGAAKRGQIRDIGARTPSPNSHAADLLVNNGGRGVAGRAAAEVRLAAADRHAQHAHPR